MKYIHHIYSIILFLCISSCQTTDLLNPIISDNDTEVLSLHFKSDDLEPVVLTKTSDPKKEIEKSIKQLYLLFFDQDGNLLKNSEGRFVGYLIPAPEVSVVKVDKEAMLEVLGGNKQMQIFVAANIEPYFFDKNKDGELSGDEVKSLDDYQKLSYVPKETVVELPDLGMPMTGTFSITLDENNGQAEELKLTALMSRIDISIQLNCDEGDANLPMIQMNDYKIGNLPTSVSLTSEGSPASEFTDIEGENRQTIYNRNGEISFSFYMFENKQGIKNYTYPESVKSDVEKQRYKPLMATGSETYLEIKARYYTYNYDAVNSAHSYYDIIYTLYLGGNHVNDFNIERNHQYKNNITIKGITRSKDGFSGIDETVTFDARVDIDKSSNYFAISSLNERELDAHIAVVPVDIYAKNDDITINVEIQNAPDWIRLEKIEKGYMSTGTAPNDTDYITPEPGEPYVAGNGMRKYFTEDLLTKNDKLGNNTSCTVQNRDRVYFYVDENVALDTNGDPVYDTREAVINFTTTPAEGQTIKQSLKLIQRGLKKVTVTRTTSGWGGGTYTSTIYIESVEEYLDHYDPLNHYDTDQIYPGLPWGAKDVETLGDDSNKSDYNADIYVNGKKNTSTILNNTGYFNSDPNLLSVPKSAAEYCYSRTKRETDGSLSTSGNWYLPAITELECILKAYYSTFPEFQDNFYWSSAPAKENGCINFLGHNHLGGKECTKRARATKAILQGGAFAYAESGNENNSDCTVAPDTNPHDFTGNDGTTGRALRTEKLRIRAAYKP